MNLETAEAILRAGGNLRMTNLNKDSCTHLARVAAAAGTHVTFVGELGRKTMVEIATAGAGHVTFDTLP